jgi:hypothetical protein
MNNDFIIVLIICSIPFITYWLLVWDMTIAIKNAKKQAKKETEEYMKKFKL